MLAYRNSDLMSVKKKFSSNEDYESFKTIEDRVKEQTINTYFSKDIQRKAGVSENEIKHWTMTGAIEPYKPVQGTGKMHIYDHQNLIETMICRELKKYSINFNLMKEVILYLRKKSWTVVFEPEFTNKTGRSSKRKTKTVAPTALSDLIRNPTSLFNGISKDLTLWDYLKIASYDASIHLVLWKDTEYLAEHPAIPKDDFFLDVTFSDLSFYTARFASLVIINMSILNNDAGYFFKEDSK